MSEDLEVRIYDIQGSVPVYGVQKVLVPGLTEDFKQLDLPAILSLLGLEPKVDVACSIAILLAGGNAEEMDCSAGMPDCASLQGRPALD